MIVTKKVSVVRTNYIELNVTKNTAANPISCGSMSQNDKCQLNFTINATGNVGSHLVIDVNFSSSDTSIEANDTEDHLIKIVAPPLNCGNLDTPGFLYNLTQDVSSAATCFTIKANNITLDCKGFEINYSQTDVGYGVNISSQNFTTIKSCDIVEGSNTGGPGVYIYRNSSNNKVFNNNITTSDVASYGVYLFQQAYNNSVYNNTITTSGFDGVGIRLKIDAYDNSIYNNTITTSGSVSSEGANGVRLTNNAYNNSIYSNTIITSSTLAYGVNLETVAYNNSIYNNSITTTGGGAYGIYSIDNVYSNSIYSNTITTSGGEFAGNSAYGIVFLTDGYNNLIYSNTITTNNTNAYGIYLTQNVYNNTFYDNNITTKNASSSYGIYLLDNVNNNTFFRNTISSFAAGILINGSGQTTADGETTRFNTFTNDTIVPCTTGCASNYQDIILTANATDITFLNVSFNKSRIAFIPNSPDAPVEINNLTVQWFLDVNVSNSTNNKGIEDAWVMINDSFANVIFNSSTDATGGIPPQIVTEFTMNGSTNSSRYFNSLDTCVGTDTHNITCFAPFNISVNFTGYANTNLSLDVNRSMLENISLTITVPAVADNTAPIVNTTFNTTSPTNIDVINFTGNVTDETGLSTANWTINFSCK